jgi:hypothetical protein
MSEHLHGIEPIVHKRSDGKVVWYDAVATPYANDEMVDGGLASTREDMNEEEARSAALLLAKAVQDLLDLPILPVRKVYDIDEIFQRPSPLERM